MTGTSWRISKTPRCDPSCLHDWLDECACAHGGPARTWMRMLCRTEADRPTWRRTGAGFALRFVVGTRDFFFLISHRTCCVSTCTAVSGCEAHPGLNSQTSSKRYLRRSCKSASATSLAARSSTSSGVGRQMESSGVGPQMEVIGDVSRCAVEHIQRRWSTNGEECARSNDLSVESLHRHEGRPIRSARARLFGRPLVLTNLPKMILLSSRQDGIHIALHVTSTGHEKLNGQDFLPRHAIGEVEQYVQAI